MSTRLSAKQLKFLELVENSCRPVYMVIGEEPRNLPHYINHDFAWDWGFLSEGAAKRWVEKLDERGFIKLERGSWARITAKGLEALKKGGIDVQVQT